MEEEDFPLTKEKAIAQLAGFIQGVINIVLKEEGITKEEITKGYLIRDELEAVCYRYVEEEIIFDLHQMTERQFDLRTLIAPGNWFTISYKKNIKEIAWTIIFLMMQNLLKTERAENTFDNSTNLE